MGIFRVIFDALDQPPSWLQAVACLKLPCGIFGNLRDGWFGVATTTRSCRARIRGTRAARARRHRCPRIVLAALAGVSYADMDPRAQEPRPESHRKVLVLAPQGLARPGHSRSAGAAASLREDDAPRAREAPPQDEEGAERGRCYCVGIMEGVPGGDPQEGSGVQGVTLRV